MDARKLVKACEGVRSWKNARGLGVVGGFAGDPGRYVFDAWALKRGFVQYDTDQDAPYFGVWVNVDRREVLTYAEGDLSLVTAPDAESFKAELASMAEFYGAPPPAFIVYGNDGTRTEVYDERPVA